MDRQIISVVNRSMSTITTAINTAQLRGGGKYAGFLAEFSPIDGSLLPIPSRLVPEELIMWGQAPKNLETLVGEEIETEKDPDGKSSCFFRRRTITVLPGVGCGLDSLDTNRSEEIYDCNNNSSTSTSKYCEKDCINTIFHVWYDNTNSVGIMDTVIGTATTKTASSESTTTTSKLRLETTFALPGDQRIRVSFDLNAMCYRNGSYRYELQSSVSSSSSIKVQWERRYDNDTDPNSHTLAANVEDRNSHLDAGTVFALIGEDLRRQRSQLTDIPQQNSSSSSTKHDNDRDDTGNSAAHHSSIDLRFFGNLVLSSSSIAPCDDEGCGDDSWFLEIGLALPLLPTIEPQEAAAGAKNERRIIRTVRRKFRGLQQCTPTYSETDGEITKG